MEVEAKMEAHLSLLLKHKKYLDGIQVVLLVVQVFGCVVSVFGKFKYMYDRLHFTEHIFQIVDTLGVIILTYSNIRIQYSLTQNIYLLDQLDLEQKINKFHSKKVDLLINLSYLVTAVILSLNAYFLIPSLEIQMIVYVIPQSLGLILFNIEMGVVLRNTYCIVGIIKHFNSSINPKNLQNSKLIDLKHTKSIWINYFKLIKWNSLLKEYNVLCQMLDEFNEKFRNILALIIACQVTLIVWSLTISLKFGLEAKNDAVENQKWLLVVPFVLIGISVFGQSVLVAWVGEQIAEEGERTIKISYLLLNSLPTLTTEHSQLVEKQVKLLLSQSKSGRIRLHAGGFFKVDFGIIGSIVATVATYCIVVIQFLLKGQI